MKKLIDFDIIYFIKSRALAGIILLFCVFSALVVFMTNQYVKEIVIQLNNSIDYLESIGEDIQESLALPYEEMENNVIKNPASYYNEQLEIVSETVSMSNCPSAFLESCTLFLPVISVLISVLLVSYDEKNRTSRLKVARYGKKVFTVSKHISGLLILFASMFFSFILMQVLNYISILDLKSLVPDVTSDFSDFETGLFVKQLLYTVVSAIIFFELTFFVCNLTHAYTVTAIAVSVGNLFLPPVFCYDLVNIKCTFENRFFDFNGVVHSSEPLEASFGIMLAESIVFIIVITVIDYAVSTKRSAFN